jgi:hypothetical protein
MANPLKVLTALSASYGAAISGSSGLQVQQGGLVVDQGGITINNNTGLVVNSNGVTVNSGGANITGQLTANSGLVVTNGAVQVSNGGISGSSTLQVGGDSTLAGNVTVQGNLTVAGTTTTVNSTNLLISDKKVVFASGSATAADASTAGIYLGNDTSAVASLQYVSSALGASGHSWTSSENINVASGKAYNLNGTNALVKNTGVASDSDLHALSNSIYGSVSVGNVGATLASIGGLRAGAGATISGSSYVFMKAPQLILSGATATTVSNALTVQGITTLQGALTASAVSGTRGDYTELFVNGVAVGVGSGDITAVLTGSSNLTGGGSSGDVTIDLANNISISSVTASVGVSASVFVLADGTQLTSSTQFGGGGTGDVTKSDINTMYGNVRFVTSSVLDANGYVEVNLTDTTNGATYFATGDLNKISVDVMTRPTGDSNYWNNDLVSVKLEVSASKLWAKIDAPASPSANYRLIAINESDFNIV